MKVTSLFDDSTIEARIKQKMTVGFPPFIRIVYQIKFSALIKNLSPIIPDMPTHAFIYNY